MRLSLNIFLHSKYGTNGGFFQPSCHPTFTFEITLPLNASFPLHYPFPTEKQKPISSCEAADTTLVIK